MNRRDFVAASCLAAASPLASMAAAPNKRKFLELRHYEIASAEKQKLFDDFLAEAAVPALRRLGIGPVGVFKMAQDENPDLWVLIQHDSLESVIGANTMMLADKEYQEAGKAVLTCPKDDPVYKRLSSSLLLAFSKCPAIERPSKKDSRVFQLRIYESHNTIMAKRKVEMFDEAGEIPLFRETGLNPVFFGESIVGSLMPNLTYMVGFDDEAAQKAAWDKFRNHPTWKDLSSRPYFKGTVSNITNLVMRPTAASQV